VDCLLFQGDGVSPLALEDVSDHIGDRGNFIWIELRSPDTRTINQLGEEFGLHELALEDAISTQQRTKLEEYGGHLFIAARTAQQWEKRIEFGETHLFAGSNFVIAIRHGAGSTYQRVAERLRRRRPEIELGTPYALYLALDLIVDQYKPVIEGLQERFQSLESLLIEAKHLGRQNLERLYELKRELTALRDAIEPMQEITQDLIRLHPEFATRELRAYYRDVHDHAVRVAAAITHLRNSTSDAMQFHLASLSLLQNESVQKLAGWGALLAVPTVVFSLYGMNFRTMPELEWPWAYPALLAVTGVAVLRLYRHLRKRGWI
jgi:magnesium transporter